jgi:hypothetical protein
MKNGIITELRRRTIESEITAEEVEEEEMGICFR